MARTKGTDKTKSGAPTTQSRGAGIANLIDKAKSTTTTSKSETPRVSLPKELLANLSAFIEASQAAKLAETRQKDAAVDLLAFGHRQRLDISRQKSTVIPSLHLTAPNGTKATFITSGWSAMKVNDGPVEVLESIFGADFSRYFTVKPQIAISNDITDEQANKLVDVLSEAGLMDLVEVNPVVTVTDSLKTDCVLDPSVSAKVEKAREEGLCRQTSYLRS